MVQNPPHIVVLLAMNADGSIADVTLDPARFRSKADQAHLEKQIAAADAVLYSAETLDAHGTTLTVKNPKLLQHRIQVVKPPLTSPYSSYTLCRAKSGNSLKKEVFLHYRVQRSADQIRLG